jgi:hypothetical protein
MTGTAALRNVSQAAACARGWAAAFCPARAEGARSRPLAVSCQTERSPKRWILLQERCSRSC